MRTITYFREFGHTKKVHGKDGFMKLHIDSKEFDLLDTIDFLFINIEGSKVPFFVNELIGGPDFLVKFEDVDTPEAASELAGKPVWIPTDEPAKDLEKEESDLEFGYLQGYNLCDRELGEIGIIDGVEAYPQQEIAIVLFRNQEVMVPLHADLIVSIDQENRKIEMELPAGLFE